MLPLHSLFLVVALCVTSSLLATTGCTKKGNKPDDQIAKPNGPRSAIAIAVSGTHAATAEKYAAAFSLTASEVRSGDIKHARELLTRLVERTKAGRDSARLQFDQQWARDIPDEAITDPKTVADKIDQYAAEWRALSTVR